VEDLTVFGIGFVVGTVVTVVLWVWLRVWLGAVASGVSLPLPQFIGMQLRRSPAQLIVDAQVALAKGGHPVDLDLVEVTYLSYRSSVKDEQDLVSLVKEALEREAASE